MENTPFLNYGSYAYQIGNDLTFIGVLSMFETEITKFWKKTETKELYFHDYEEYIFPLLEEKPLKELTEDDFNLLLEKIKDKRAEDNLLFTAGIEARYKRLIRKVTKAAAAHDICGDVLWGSSSFVDYGEDVLKQTAERRARVPRYLLPSQEMALEYALFADPEADGETLGLAIMDATGARNEEACALDFGSINKVTDYQFWVVALAINVTKRGSNELRGGGKTMNAPRIVPLIQKLLDLILKRKAMLEEKIRIGELTEVGPGKLYETIDDMPIVCHGTDYLTRSQPKYLTGKAKFLFQKIGVAEDVMTEISDEYYRLKTLGRVSEKDPTAYLFRRNFATHLAILGFTDDEMTYLMGHSLIDSLTDKSTYTNPDRLKQIYDRMSERPILNDTKTTGSRVNLRECKRTKTVICEEDHIYVFGEAGKNYRLHAQFVPMGSSNMTISVKSEPSKKIDGTASRVPVEISSEKNPSMMKMYKKYYQNRKKTQIPTVTDSTDNIDIINDVGV